MVEIPNLIELLIIRELIKENYRILEKEDILINKVQRNNLLVLLEKTPKLLEDPSLKMDYT
jgi:hypothetical protein